MISYDNLEAFSCTPVSILKLRLGIIIMLKLGEKIYLHVDPCMLYVSCNVKINSKFETCPNARNDQFFAV